MSILVTTDAVLPLKNCSLLTVKTSVFSHNVNTTIQFSTFEYTWFNEIICLPCNSKLNQSFMNARGIASLMCVF